MYCNRRMRKSEEWSILVHLLLRTVLVVASVANCNYMANTEFEGFLWTGTDGVHV